MKKTLLIINILLLSAFITLGCDCKTKTVEEIRESSYKNSDIVFLGELIKSENEQHEFSFSIIEIFKGKADTKKIKIIANTSCSYDNFSDGIWLIYGNYQADSTLDVSICGASRSFDNPEILPPMLNKLRFTEFDSLYGELSSVKNKSESLAMLISDIELYRSKKQNCSSIENKMNYWEYLIAISLILNIIMLVLLYKKKNASR